MQPKILSKRVLLIVIPLGIMLITALFGCSASLLKDFPEEKVSFGLPVHLKIPAIGVDAPVISVGLTSDGAMDVPKDPIEVAWYDRGPRPGENGSSVIAGHYGWKNNLPAVFDDLHKLVKGDKISVEDDKGVVTTFVVREIRIYDKDQDASDVFGSNDGKVHLNLITCTGAWNNEEKTFSKRLIVFTDQGVDS
ncbi:sortase [Candidatus Peregrinibacteria bacterium CG11_big_fil_rev_8_21_14_0_20_41_10]|nr:MAG: sortase [Candidatus Peregrinibacteria bacterium CG11_big_fil_rev_8_21_14_0_20_41_10]PIZ73042.1 MAG: sortase [Candidatus Peregrinibacteria bacterium CG_4_10_14_0_2_um_filter_41_8]PJC37759.1 MAG: sortase [Candidatus Peregrinibacteria bacterium CG_4_9_14_0_2_um_filter_41_14]